MTHNLSKERELLLLRLSEKQFRSEHLDFVTNRQVHHWKEIGLIDDYRKYAASGMKSSFNFYEVLWIRIISEIRSFQISNTSIKIIKKFLFDSSGNDENKSLSILQESILEIFLNEKIEFLVIVKDNESRALDKQKYLQEINDGSIGHHFSLQLDLLIGELLDVLDFKSKAKEVIGQ